jgi:hypothetical protein
LQLDKLKISRDISAVEQIAISFLLGEKSNTAAIGTVQDAARSSKVYHPIPFPQFTP